MATLCTRNLAKFQSIFILSQTQKCLFTRHAVPLIDSVKQLPGISNRINPITSTIINRWYGNSNNSNTPPPTTDDLSKLSTNETLHNIQTPSNLSDFRQREEKREQEFAQQADEPTGNTTEDEQRIATFRVQILNAALPFVSTHGWSREAIAKGAEAQGYPGVAHGMFPNGGIELIHHFYAQCNAQLIEQLQSEVAKAVKDETARPILEFVGHALKLRLQMIEPYLANWPQALAMMSLPQNVPTSLAQLLTLVDDICYYAGDRSVDLNWYTRRIGLATIYKMTELYMLRDSSMNHQETWTFLERRLEEGNHLQAALDFSDEKTRNLTRALSSAFSTARNILGVNFDRR